MIVSLDFHAHIDPAIPIHDLDRLESCIVAVTRTTNDYKTTLSRPHPSTLWAVGAHPSLATVHKRFDKSEFEAALSRTAIVGEVGLDGRSSASLELQLRTLNAIFEATSRRPRLMTVHSSFATMALLEVLEHRRPRGVVLHWWSGDQEQTKRALDLGCYFSINFAQTRNPSIVDILPADRVLTETDHPFGDRLQPGLRLPGVVAEVEKYLAKSWSMDIQTTRRQIWQNLKVLATSTQTLDMLPRDFQATLLSL